MALFLSTYVNKIDRKGRVSVPARFRAVLAQRNASDPAFGGVVAFMSLSVPAIVACGLDYMEGLTQGLGEFNPFSEDYDDFADAIMPTSHELAFDGEGRIMLPPDLTKDAGIADRVAFVGRGETFQMWQPEAFERRLVEARQRAREKRGSLPRTRPVDGGRHD